LDAAVRISGEYGKVATAMNARAAVFALFVTVALLPGHATSAQYAVYVFTAAEAQSTAAPGVADLHDSVDDVKKALAARKYQDVFTLAEDRDQADVLIEVMWRGELETEETGPHVRIVPGDPGGVSSVGPHRILQNNLRVKLTHRGSQTELWAIEPGKAGWLGNAPRLSWRDLAEKTVDKIAGLIRHER
jgi:hypothetical protein